MHCVCVSVCVCLCMCVQIESHTGYRLLFTKSLKIKYWDTLGNNKVAFSLGSICRSMCLLVCAKICYLQDLCVIIVITWKTSLVCLSGYMVSHTGTQCVAIFY